MSDFSNITTRNNTTIEDAKAAISSLDKVYNFLNIENTRFNRNIVGISLKNPSMLPHSPTVTNFKGNTFDCDAPLNGIFSNICFAGIELENTYLFATKNQEEENLFIRIENGIYATGNTRVSIDNFRFNDINNNGIYHENTSLKLTNCTFNQNGTFNQNSTKFINASAVRDLTLIECNFNYNVPAGEEAYGVFAESFEFNSDVQIVNNNFSANKIGGRAYLAIYLKAGIVSPETNINLFGNNFTEFTNPRGGCINIEGEFLNTKSIRIENNKFLDIDMATFLVSINGGDKSNLSIFNNEIDGNNGFEENGSLNTPQIGFVLEGSRGINNEVSLNRFIPDFNVSHTSANANLGIRSTMFWNTKYCDNLIADAARGIQFRESNFGTDLIRTRFFGGSTVFSIDGIIGAQGEMGEDHNGNTWQNKFLGIHSKLECVSNNCNLSPIYVHTEQEIREFLPVFYPGNPPNLSPAVLPETGWFVVDFTGFPKGSCSNQLTGDTPELLFTRIADGELNEKPGIIWEANNFLYEKLHDDPLFMSEYSSFQTFYDEKANSTTGQLYDIFQNINSALDKPSYILDSENYLSQIEIIESEIENIDEQVRINGLTEQNKIDKSALLFNLFEKNILNDNVIRTYKADVVNDFDDLLMQNEQISTTEIFEQNEQNVNKIFLSSLVEGRSELTEGEINILVDIALQCPQYGGVSVYKARGLLPVCVRLDYEDEFEECFLREDDIIDERSNESGTHWDRLSEALEMYPNPTSNLLNIKNAKSLSGQIKITDLFGHELLLYKISKRDSIINLDLDLPSGVYIVSINYEDGTVSSDNLIIQ